LEELKPGTRNRYLRILRAAFNLAIKRGYTKTNPVSKMDFAVLPSRSIRIFSNQQIEGFLRTSLESEIEMLPYFALGSFAGLRVGGGVLSKLLWSDIKLTESKPTIVVRPEISKTGKRRLIPISDNLKLWLSEYIERKGVDPLWDMKVIRLPYGTLRKVRKRIFEKVSPNKQWIPAGLRHSFTSAMINSGKGIDETCLELGHQGSPTMLFNHYYLAMPTEQATAYWQIVP
jgi:integrase